MDSILETPRLFLREIQTHDYMPICLILQDIDVMYAWEHAFSDGEVADWIHENMQRYKKDGFGYWAVVEKSSNHLVGVCGLIREQAGQQSCVGVGYLLKKKYWGRGDAVESARACVEYAFCVLQLKEITAQIRPENISSRKVAEKLGMTVKERFIKNYRGKDMPHLLYYLPAKA